MKTIFDAIYLISLSSGLYSLNTSNALSKWVTHDAFNYHMCSVLMYIFCQWHRGESTRIELGVLQVILMFMELKIRNHGILVAIHCSKCISLTYLAYYHYYYQIIVACVVWKYKWFEINHVHYSIHSGYGTVDFLTIKVCFQVTCI